MSRAQSGRAGEAAAQKHYQQDGYQTLCQNYATRQGEIDLILKKGDLLVFAEVKTRAADAIAAPREWVDARKQQRIILAAQGYLAQAGSQECFVRFDVVEVILQPGGHMDIRRIEDAFTL